MKRLVLVVILVSVLLAGCCEPQVVNKEDLEALQDLQNPIFSDYLKRVDADPALEPAQKKARHLGVEAAQDFVLKSISRFDRSEEEEAK